MPSFCSWAGAVQFQILSVRVGARREVGVEQREAELPRALERAIEPNQPQHPPPPVRNYRWLNGSAVGRYCPHAKDSVSCSVASGGSIMTATVRKPLAF